MELVTIRQMQSADSHAINTLGIPARTLMLNAAKALVKSIPDIKRRTLNAAVFCGPGNNGGDGWATALILKETGNDVTVITAKEPRTLSGSAGYYAAKAVSSGIPVENNIDKENLDKFDIVIDAVFGTGLSKEVKGIYLDYIDTINSADCFTISADTPSGLYSDEGIPFPMAVKADMTICFGRAKTSLFGETGCNYTGSIITDGIGIPEESYEITTVFTTDKVLAGKIYKKRSRTGFKGNYGKILVIAGSPGMTGAAGLCAKACFRSGAGLVYLTVPESVKYEYEGLVQEAIGIPVEDNKMQYVSEISVEDILKAAKGKSGIIIGPGLHKKSNSHKICETLLNETDLPHIIDAQTINDLKNDVDILYSGKGKVIITPHPGEMSVLTGYPIEYIQKNRISVAVEFASRYGIIVLLKGHRTVITNGDEVYINTTGNPGMATAGSGDVLCGIIASALSYAPSLLEAAAVSAYIHGVAGDEAAVLSGEYGMKSGDIIKRIPETIKKLTGE